MSMWMTSGGHRIKSHRRIKHGGRANHVDTRLPFRHGAVTSGGLKSFGAAPASAPKRVNPYSNPFEEYKLGSPPVARVAMRALHRGMGSPSGSSDIY
eukprot:CAMPEP_0118664706 /NCGR_PEP_ID=MMETSP0785-20121206/18178_1 /TAXON_ID=91992 /ORGANISM="Bolidomonas pacifica, Strain CCMP 1866" /LENGTH=96 /DNA_ID=CAMNT_0006558675 /DNA_START=85 /DNA_END=372 /DNA_ORIENTATION=+